eukprot:27182-Pelagococcus_subviridis.AAC.4
MYDTYACQNGISPGKKDRDTPAGTPRGGWLLARGAALTASHAVARASRTRLARRGRIRRRRVPPSGVRRPLRRRRRRVDGAPNRAVRRHRARADRDSAAVHRRRRRRDRVRAVLVRPSARPPRPLDDSDGRVPGRASARRALPSRANGMCL